MTIGPFLFDGPAQPSPFFDRPQTGRAKTGRASPFATPSATCSREFPWWSISWWPLLCRQALYQ